jgi:hypothetical protein
MSITSRLAKLASVILNEQLYFTFQVWRQNFVISRNFVEPLRNFAKFQRNIASIQGCQVAAVKFGSLNKLLAVGNS